MINFILCLNFIFTNNAEDMKLKDFVYSLQMKKKIPIQLMYHRFVCCTQNVWTWAVVAPKFMEIYVKCVLLRKDFELICVCVCLRSKLLR